MAPSFNPFRSLFAALMLCCMALLMVAGLKSYRELGIARERERLLESRIEGTQERLVDLRQRIERLRHDPATLERLAREQHGLVKPGELIIVLPETPLEPERRASE